MEIPSGNNLRLALYCRVSTEEQREGQTIESQIKELENFAGQKGWLVMGLYKDEGWSGAILARPALDRLRDDASRKLFDAVLINDVDRLARDVSQLGVIRRDLERLGVQVIFRKLPGENGPTHNLMVNILGSFAEFERELIADRTRRGKRYKVETRKEYLGAIAPYGFRYTPAHRANPGEAGLKILPEEAALVQEMYRWVDEEGLSAQKVVARLNESGVLPRKKGKQWQMSTVLRILRSEVYAGVWHYNKHQKRQPLRPRMDDKYRRAMKSSNRLRDKTEWLRVPLPQDLRIIERTRWERVQMQLDRNLTFSPRNGKHSYLLKSLVRCGGCQASYVGDVSHGRFAYRCVKRCRKYPSINEEYLNETVWNGLEGALQNPETILSAITKIHRQHGGRITAHNDELATANASLAGIREEESRILEAYRLQILSVEQLRRELQELNARKLLLESVACENEAGRKSNMPAVRRSLKQYCELVSQKLAGLDWQGRQRLLRLLVRRVMFEGTQVRVSAEIALQEADSEADPEPAGIAEIMSWICGRNTLGSIGIANTISSRYGGNSDTQRDLAGDAAFIALGRLEGIPSVPGESPSIVTFELVAEVKRNPENRLRASRANLMKANVALQKLRRSRPSKNDRRRAKYKGQLSIQND